MQARSRGWIILGLFFFSGATALVYEVVWSKFLSQMFGSTIYAQTVVLAVFMGGLAIGNWVFGGWADRMHRPVRGYGFLEIAIGIYAFLFPTLFYLADQIFVVLGMRMAESSAALLVLKGGLSAALLLGPTVLMGGTLPLMAAWLQQSTSDAGRRSARFYSVNSLGAVAGAAWAGFWLVQTLGMVASLQATALVNIGIGGMAILLARDGSKGQAHGSDVAPTGGSEMAVSPRLRWAALVVTLTGAVSMGLEVLSARSLAMIFGSSLQSFAIVLMAFILGIGLGSAWIASPRRRIVSSERAVVVLLCVAAAWVVLLVFNIEEWVDVYRRVAVGIARNGTGYLYHQLVTGALALLVLGLPAACLGAVLPLMIRAASQDGRMLGARVGRLLTWNTLGAVGGTLLTGFLLMPVAGVRNAFGVLALLVALAAMATAVRSRWRVGQAGAGLVCAGAVCLFAIGDSGWRHVMSSGVFRAREKEFNPITMSLRKQYIEILFYEDAPDATVSVERRHDTGASDGLSLRVNGKPDASTHVDLSTQLLLAHLPMLARPGAKDVFMLGLGSGVSAGALLAYPVEQAVVAENCEPVVRAARLFEPWNRAALDDPRIRIWGEDARTVLKLHPQLYDVIITQPSNPWTAGIGSVFSREYYELAASRLKPGGIVAQWFHVYEMHDGIVSMVLRTFGTVFPFVEVWDTGKGDIVLLGSLQPWAAEPEGFRHGFALEGVRADMASIGIHSPEALVARQLASQRTAFAIPGPGAIQTDQFPVLEYAAPRAFYIGVSSTVLNRFDERTCEQLLAPASKRDTLQALAPQEVRSVFAVYKSMNSELLDSMKGNETADSPASIFGAGLRQQPGLEVANSSEAKLRPVDEAVEALNAGELRRTREMLMSPPGSREEAQRIGYLSRILEREREFKLARTTRESGGG